MRKNLLLGLLTLFTFAGLLCSSVAHGQATLKHSYTFEEGTYEGTTIFDQTGTLNGTMVGDAISIDSGKCVVSGATSNTDGYVVFDGVELALASYNAVTLEAYLETGEVLNSTYTMLAYFGSTSQGTNCFWIQPTRAATETRIETNNGSSTINAILGGYEVDDGLKHHLVAVLNADALIYYLDGVVIAETSTAGADYVSTIGTDIAQLFKGPDGWPDPNYNCWLEEFNIYDGTLDAFTIGQRAGVYLGLDLYNATLDTITVTPGALEPAFTADNDFYEVEVPYGTTSITIGAKPAIGGATTTIYNGLGEELENGVLTFDKEEGDFAEIVVTALDGVTEQSYYIDVFPEPGEASATLASIDLSAGAFTTSFDMYDTAYVAIVPNGTVSVDVTGVANWNNATVVGNGTVTLVDGMGSATITVTSEDATNTSVYTVEVYTSVFVTGTDFYLVHEANGFVAAESGATFNQVVLEEAVLDSTTQIWQFVESGEEGQYYIQNKDGHYMCLSRTGAAYDLEVYPDLPSNELDSARFILNEFAPGRFKIISVARQNIPSTNNMLSPNNPQLGSPLFSDKGPGSVADAAGYTVWNLKFPEDVASSYETHLSSLTMTGASFTPVFDPAYTTYYASIPAGVTSVEIAATAKDPSSTVSGTGTINVSDGKGTITVTVAASDPQYTREYMIHYVEPGIRHQFTFEEGTYDATTVYDQVGSVNGTLGGKKISIADGKATVAGAGANNDGWISMDGAALALNTYSNITIEVMLQAGDLENTGFTMLTYFGTSSPGNGCLWIQPSRSGNESRIETNNGSSTITAALPGYEIDDSLKHHVAAVLDQSSLKYYLDGEVVSEVSTNGADFIRTIGTNVANIFRGVDGWNDPNYNGSIYEYNIWEGGLDDATILERANEFLGGLSRDASLSAINVDAGELLPEFDPEVTMYTVVVPLGTTTVNVTAVPNDQNATIVGDGAIDVSSGAVKDTIVVTAEDGFRTKTYIVSFEAPSEYTLMHSYTFDDGTAADVVGGADGTLGSGIIADGAFTSVSDSDYVELPAATIAINTYTEITLEAFIFADVDNTGSNMMAYFGGNENAVGGNGYFVTPDRNTQSRTAISCGNVTQPWNAEQGVTGSPVSVGEMHHVVSVLTNSSIKFYIDGILVGEAAVSEPNSIAALSNANAWLGKGGYTADPSWNGSIDEFNIYQGVMDAATIKQRADAYLGNLALMHSYTFEDGTAIDVVGDADGTLMEGATIVDGSAILDAAGEYISLDAAEIAINQYSSITVEAFITASNVTFDGNGNATLFYFGNTIDTWKGYDYLYVQGTTGNSNSTAAFSTPGNVGDPWNFENKIGGPAMNDSSRYHVVLVIEGSTMTYYVNGISQGSVTLTGTNAISALGTELAWIGKAGYQNDPTFQASIDEFNIYQGAMGASLIATRADGYLNQSDARLAALTSNVGSVLPGVNTGITHYAVLVPEGTTAVTLTATPYVSTATVSGDGVIDLTEGETSVTIEITSTDGTVTKDYTVDIVIEDGSCSAELDANNLVADPEMTDMSKWQGWGSKALVYGHEAYCGGSSMKLGNGGDGCDAALDISPFVFQPNTTYRVRVMVKTIDGSIGFLAKGSDPNVEFAINTNGEWMQVDTTFTTGDNPAGEFISFNKCDAGSNCTYCYIDNYEIFVDNGTSVGDIDESAIRVYPTYSTGDFKVETDGSHGTITVYNLTGKQVLQKVIESSLETVTVRDRGMYILKVENEDTYRTFKVFKTR
ncbi:LamG-like jellyroll fold domain-containing protein [Maribellus sediminis]|uniref:LamG-like jellyroll fold domain-containing protein n=1 Tax=Maribellus sediminis TaxID=2696285 RepID=UPI001430D482|nr:LamG-like jellyroll fold domain-containing protein [Maribellus sediminis]